MAQAEAKKWAVNWMQSQTKDSLKKLFVKETGENMEVEKIVIDCVIETIRQKWLIWPQKRPSLANMLQHVCLSYVSDVEEDTGPFLGKKFVYRWCAVYTAEHICKWPKHRCTEKSTAIKLLATGGGNMLCKKCG